MAKKLTISPDNLHEIPFAIRYLLARHDIDEAVKVYRSLKRTYPDTEYLEQARTLIGESLRGRLAEFLDDISADLGLRTPYLIGFEKKLDIRSDIPHFSALARKILEEGRALLHLDRLYTIYQSLLNIDDVAGDILEVGVYQGGTLKFIAQVCAGLEARRAIFGLDTFRGHAGITQEDGPSHFEGMFKDHGLEEISDYLKDEQDVTLVAGDVRETLDGVLARIDRIAFVHLDLDLYEPTAFSLPRLAGKVVPGGIILLDDYGFITCPGAKKATDEFLKAGGFTHFHLLTGQCILIKRES